MKKASIITLQYIDNYGSVLQTLATQEVFRSMGCETEVVNYTRENCTYIFQRKLAYQRYKNRGGIFSFYPVAKMLQLRWSLLVRRRANIFNSFRKRYINMSKKYYSSQDLIASPPVADIYVTGSDQTWNPEYNGGVLGEYFLNYAPNGAKKISFSASIGTERIAEEFAKFIAQHLEVYDGISVRESSAVGALKELGYYDVVHILDPTLMLDKSEWTNCLTLKETKKQYVFMYQLNDNAEMVKFATQIANDNDIELISVTTKSKHFDCKHRTFQNCTPEKFLELLKNATYVVTDSFHGTAFSFNFNKNVFVFTPPKYSTRLVSILQLLESEFRLVNGASWNEIQEINFDKVNSILASERQKAVDFLSQYLN